jgi:hypothetical protein
MLRIILLVFYSYQLTADDDMLLKSTRESVYCNLLFNYPLIIDTGKPNILISCVFALIIPESKGIDEINQASALRILE